MCRVARDDSLQLVQRVNGDLGLTSGHRGARRGVAHPRRNLPRQAGPDLDVEDLPAAALGSLAQA
jgi:hypothetical protein